ncbi:hypothetical protein RNB18_49975 [Streptomyces sp. DSM 41640]|uniref:Uncharacterized protein n=1 Tax=Streptomyces doebereineriae TaxID=3075528 RepID=A0ABU2VRF0_9ACTN|nr:hypothetical protein [Streptomyces sp. DSM 41640]MDT0488194.1 hypothetical protein [Streptomyces sp. DSM 41640]
MAGPTVRRGMTLGLGALWWWAVARLVLTPDAGGIEGAIAAGGWGLSLLPVHCVPKGRAAGAVGAGRWRQAWRAGRPAEAGRSGGAGEATTASPPRRSGG